MARRSSCALLKRIDSFTRAEDAIHDTVCVHHGQQNGETDHRHRCTLNHESILAGGITHHIVAKAP